MFTNIVFVIKCSKRETKEVFVSRANSSLVGILITIGDVTDIFAIFMLFSLCLVRVMAENGLFIKDFVTDAPETTALNLAVKS